MVINPNKKVLFIYRNNVWDLPKGHIEKNESTESAAVREVEEECGIENSTIIQKLIITYHIYFLDGIKLKETHWFLMHSDDSNNLIPQLEEGITEVALKDHVGDKTNWRTMLKNDIVDENLVEWRERLKQYIPDEAQDYYIASNTETNIDFPVEKYPLKPKSLNIQKDQVYTGKLTGIKGQYLIFEDDTVFNVRSNEGLVVNVSVN